MTAEPSITPLVMPVAEAIRFSGLSRSELYRRLAAGDLKAKKSGRKLLILADSLRAHLDSLPDATFRRVKSL